MLVLSVTRMLSKFLCFDTLQWLQSSAEVIALQVESHSNLKIVQSKSTRVAQDFALDIQGGISKVYTQSATRAFNLQIYLNLELHHALLRTSEWDPLLQMQYL